MSKRLTLAGMFVSLGLICRRSPIRSRRTRTLLAWSLGVSTWLASSVGALAQPGWTPPVPLAVAATSPRVGTDSAGNSVAVWPGADGIKASDYAVSVGAWSPVVTLRPTADRFLPPYVVMTGGGRAFAAWTYLGPTGSPVVRAEFATFSAQSRAWSAASLLADGFRMSGLAADASGNAMAAMTREIPAAGTEFAVARYDAGSGAWGAPVRLLLTGASTSLRLVMSSGGDAFAVLEDLSFNGGPSVARYDRATNTWQSPVSFGVCNGSSCQSGLVIATDANGRALAAWGNAVAGTGISTKTSLYENGAWTPLPDLPYSAQARVALAGGRAAVSLFDHTAAVIRGTTLDLASRVWTAPVEIGTTGASRPSGGPSFYPLWDLVMDEGGHGFVIWDVFVSGTLDRIDVARFAATTGLWSPPATLTQAGNSPTIAMASSGAAIAGWNDYSGGSPTFSVSRYSIGSAAPILAPAVVSRPNVTFTWMPPTSGAPPSGYTLVASLSAGGPPVAQLPVGTQTSVVVSAPDGTFYVKVVAIVGGAAVASNEIRVDVTPPSLPGPPQQLTTTVAGNVVSLTWQAPADTGGAPVVGYVLEAGSAAGASNLARLTLGSATSFVSPAIPNGSYFLRVRAVNAAGVGVATPEVRVIVGPPPPSAPTLSGGAVAAGAVSFVWTVPSAGASATGYRLVAGTAPGLSNAAAINLPATATSFAIGGVPAGTYYVRVHAHSAVGLGFASNELMVVVPHTDSFELFTGPANSPAGSGTFAWLISRSAQSIVGTDVGVVAGTVSYNASVSGTISGTTLTFQTVGTSPGGTCAVSITGAATMTPTTISGTYSGTTCNGPLGAGTFSLTRQ